MLKQLKTDLKCKFSQKPGEKGFLARPLGPRPRFGQAGAEPEANASQKKKTKARLSPRARSEGQKRGFGRPSEEKVR